MVPHPKIQTGNLVVENHDMVLVQSVFVLVDPKLHNLNQVKSLLKSTFQKMQVYFIGIDIQKCQGGQVVVPRKVLSGNHGFQPVQSGTKLAGVFHEKQRLQQIVVSFKVKDRVEQDHVGLFVKEVYPFAGIFIG